MFFKKPERTDGPSGNLRRKFHHFLLKKRKTPLPRYAPLARHRHPARSFSHNQRFASLKKPALFLAVTGVLFGLIYTVFFSSFFIISHVALERHGNSVAAASLSPFLDQMKDRNILFFSGEKLEKEMEQNFPNQILSVQIKKRFPRRLKVEVHEYPAALNLHVITPVQTQKFILNQLGFSVGENMEEKEIPVLILRQPKPFVSDGTLIPKEKLEPIEQSFRTFYDLFGMKITEGEWKKTERELHLRTERGFHLWLDLTAPIEPQFKKLKRALPKLDIYRESIEYIDLRIAGGESEKVIWKKL